MSLIFVETTIYNSSTVEKARQVDPRVLLANNKYNEFIPIEYCEQKHSLCFRILYNRRMKRYISTVLSPCTYRKIEVFY